MIAITNWFHMHGYAVYLWPAYSAVTVVLAGNLLRSIWQGKNLRAQLRSRLERS